MFFIFSGSTDRVRFQGQKSLYERPYEEEEACGFPLVPEKVEEDNDAPCSGSPWPHVREVMPGASMGEGLDGPQ